MSFLYYLWTVVDTHLLPVCADWEVIFGLGKVFTSNSTFVNASWQHGPILPTVKAPEPTADANLVVGMNVIVGNNDTIWEPQSECLPISLAILNQRTAVLQFLTRRNTIFGDRCMALATTLLVLGSTFQPWSGSVSAVHHNQNARQPAAT